MNVSVYFGSKTCNKKELGYEEHLTTILHFVLGAASKILLKLTQ